MGVNPGNPFPHLLKLLDDPSPVVQEEVRKALLPMASDISQYLKIFPATSVQRESLKRILTGWRRTQILARWPAWNNGNPKQSLEKAHELLGNFALGWQYEQNLAEKLDSLAQKCRDSNQALTLESLPSLLATWLEGNQEDYYDPANSLLREVLERGRGNPISLCCILILVGERLGLDYWGINYPGHFLARFETAQGPRYVDCFRQGTLLEPQLTPELRGKLANSELQAILEQEVQVEHILQRVLRNLVNTSSQRGERSQAHLYDLLLKDMLARGQGLGKTSGLRQPLYIPGQVVRHKEKDYRGVVVDYDLYVDQEDGLEYQPLYRVLVHGSPTVTQVREEKLALEEGRVAHPFLSMFFSSFEDGIYIRNSQPWESQ